MAYLSPDDKAELSNITDTNFETIGAGTFNEVAILEKIKSGGNIQEFFQIAVHFALHGQGGKVFKGAIRLDGKDIEISDMCKRLKIEFNEKNEHLAEDEITLKRLVRIFVFQIQDYIKTKNVNSSLSNKYLLDNDIHSGVFIGAEYLPNNPEMDALIKAYECIDQLQETNFAHNAIIIQKIINAKALGKFKE